jgi:serine/threonine protein kinase
LSLTSTRTKYRERFPSTEQRTIIMQSMATGTKLKGRYELKEVLAKGGMGVVYRAVDTVMRRQVAIKTLLDLTDNTGFQLFQKECEVLASMTHPNIIEIYDVGQVQEDGMSRPYLVMPLLPGSTLDKLIRGGSQRLTVERSIDIICQACRGLQAAHEKGLLHRDIKPSNIFVMEDDSVKIIDFGVAHRLETNRTVGRKGTLLYMAPEQIEMKPLSAASDIFSLGIVCYEALTNRRPFERGSENSVAEAILHYIPVPASELNVAVNRTISQAIHKAMAKQPWHRYSTAREFAETLQKALRNDRIEIFNPLRIRPRLQRAAETLERGDYQYASEIVGELEAEGHLDPSIRDLRGKIDEAIRRKTMDQLLETARSRMEEEEFPLALQKLYEILQLDPVHPEALALKGQIETQRTEREIDDWFQLAHRYVDECAFSDARQTLQRILQRRPNESRARQLLSQVDRSEQEFLSARQEKERLYRAAVEAGQRGDISSALTKLERVLDLDRRLADPAAPERRAAYQSLYQQLRSEHDALQQAYAESKRHLETGNFSAALSLCTDQLTKYPEDALFQALKLDIEERYRQAVSARIAETNRKVDAEPDLDRRIAIMEEAVRTCPGEPHFEQLLQRTRDKYNLVESIVARARMHEQQLQFGEALSQWEILQTIYGRYPGLSMEIDRVTRRREQHLRGEARNRWVEQIDRLLEGRDYSRALELVMRAQEEHPGDAELAQLENLVRQGLEKTAQAERLLARGRAESKAGCYPESIDTLKRAYELDDRNPAIRSTLRDTLMGRARQLFHSDPSGAESLLRQVLEFDAENASAHGLLRQIAERRSRELVEQAASQPQLQFEGNTAAAKRASEDGVAAVPGEATPDRDLEKVNQVDRDAETLFEPPTLQTYAELVPRSPEPVPARSEPLPAHSEPLPASPERVEPVATPAPASGTAVARTQWLRVLAAVRRLPKIWGVVAIAVAFFVGLIIVSKIVIRKPLPPPNAVSTQPGIVEISTVPSGAVIFVDGKESGTAASPLRLSLAAAPAIHIEARLPGYRTAQTTVNLKTGAGIPVELVLAPVLTLKVILSGEGQVALNGGPPVPVQDGQFSQEVPVAHYSVKINTPRNGSMTFGFDVVPEGQAVVTQAPEVKELSALLVSNFGEKARIYTGGSGGKVALDGRPLGDLDRKGMDLPNVSAGSHELRLGEGGDLRKKAIEIGPDRTLTAIIDADPNTGNLLVLTNEDNVAISVLADGKELAKGETKNRRYRKPGLAPKTYTVRASKEGYDAVPQEWQAEVRKREEKTVSFEFRRQPLLTSIRIHQTPGSELFVDGASQGATPDETRTVDKLTAAAHTFRAQKARFQPGSPTTVELAEKRIAEVDLRLVPAPVPVEIRKNPADSTVTYSRTPDTTVHALNGTTVELAEGDYVFNAKAKGYMERNASVHISWDTAMPIDVTQNAVKSVDARRLWTIADWGPGIWTAANNYFTSKVPGPVLFPKAVGTGSIEFAIHLDGGKGHAQWLLQYRNDKNYLLCELDGGGFQITRVSEGTREIVTRKKAVPKMDWYPVRIDVEPNRITHKLLKNGAWGVLDSVAGAGSNEGQFGFNIAGGRQISVANFRASPER